LRARSWAVLTTSNFPGHSSSLTALIVGLGADNPGRHFVGVSTL
jgi:hypothetical protein